MNSYVPAYLADTYAEKESTYFSSARLDYILELPDAPNSRILELGCGNGATGVLALRAKKCSTYVGIEMFGPAADAARQVLTHVHSGDIAAIELPYEPATFDALILSEVLEHLVEPERELRRLVRLLRPGGLVFASSPNISHWRIIASLLLGRFDYSDFGAMDRTHLRWFTPKSFQSLFESCGVEVTKVQRLAELSRMKAALLYFLGPRLEHLFWYQIDLRGRRRLS
jgi:SAM-dependent methyltransferase